MQTPKCSCRLSPTSQMRICRGADICEYILPIETISNHAIIRICLGMPIWYIALTALWSEPISIARIASTNGEWRMSDQTPGVTPTPGPCAGAEKNNIYKNMASDAENEVGDQIGDVNTTYASSKSLRY